MTQIAFSAFEALVQPALDYNESRDISADAFRTLVGDSELSLFEESDKLLDAYIAVVAKVLAVDEDILANWVLNEQKTGITTAAELYETLRAL